MNVISIDIGGTKISCSVVNEDGEILELTKRPTNASESANHVLHLAFTMIDEFSNKYDFEGIGISSAGRIDVKRGIVKFATSNLPGWSGLNLKEIFKARYKVNVEVDNDVNCVAIGEGWLGSARGIGNYVCLALGTGVGGAFVFKNEILRGSEWNGAELGHMIIKADGRPCNCGLKGCVEQYVSGNAICNRYNELTGNNINSAAHVFDLYKQKDSISIEVINEYKYFLTETILSLNNIFDPDCYVIGGGILAEKDCWWDDVIEGVNHYKHTLILPALLENNAGLVGAAKLILNSISNKLS